MERICMESIRKWMYLYLSSAAELNSRLSEKIAHAKRLHAEKSSEWLVEVVQLISD